MFDFILFCFSVFIVVFCLNHIFNVWMGYVDEENKKMGIKRQQLNDRKYKKRSLLTTSNNSDSMLIT